MHISNFIKEGDFKNDVDYGEEFYDEINKVLWENENYYNFKSSTINMDDGIEVYFPIDNNYDVGVHHKLYYYSENSNIEEKYDGVVVEENNKKYIKFITHNFSTYVLLNEEINNPATGDNIVLLVILILYLF